jgi:hypothetical protein
MNYNNLLAVGPFIWASLAFYVLSSLPLFTMGKKVGSPNAWFAFVPILNIVLMLEIAGKDLWWLILFFIPCVNVVVMAVVWMGIAEAMEKPSWLGLLIFVPGVSFLLPFYLAFA